MQHTEIKTGAPEYISQASNIRRLPDHSIDYDYYWHETRRQRAAEAAHLFTKAKDALGRLFHHAPSSRQSFD